MSTDINGTVVAIQGNPVSAATPADGDMLVWDGADGYWRPYSPAKASAYSTSGQSTTGVNNRLKITNWTTLFDTSSSFDTTNSRYVAPVSAYYNIFGQWQIDAPSSTIAFGEQIRASIFVNGSEVHNLFFMAPAAPTSTSNIIYYTCQWNNLVYVSAGQYIEFYISTASTGTLVMEGAGFSQGCFVNIVQL